jgi:hypothetical protein
MPSKFGQRALCGALGLSSGTAPSRLPTNTPDPTITYVLLPTNDTRMREMTGSIACRRPKRSRHRTASLGGRHRSSRRFPSGCWLAPSRGQCNPRAIADATAKDTSARLMVMPPARLIGCRHRRLSYQSSSPAVFRFNALETRKTDACGRIKLSCLFSCLRKNPR